MREAGEKLEEFGVLDDLYRTASGNVRGARKIPLENYLLQYYFRRVIIAANARLSRMSEGRFSLCQKQEEGLGGKAGLALDVLDRHTGKVRDVGTLSGGESFLASLAMALGFADVVQAAAAEACGWIRCSSTKASARWMRKAASQRFMCSRSWPAGSGWSA